jgi:hypothetical protein
MFAAKLAVIATMALSSAWAFGVKLDPPSQIHIAFAGVDENGDPNGMVISWQTENPTKTSTVMYGFSDSDLSLEGIGIQQTYYQTWDHHVILQDLKPSTTYYYSCGDSLGGFSPTFSFTTAPSRDTVEYPMNIAIFGDMGVYYSEDSRLTLTTMGLQKEYDWIWHLGDISYADDDFVHNPLEDNYEETWNFYMRAIQAFSAQFPYMVMAGNHEAECHSPACETSRYKLEHLGNFSAYNSRFRMPSQESGGNSNMWYSFNYGPIHFINIDTETDFEGAPTDHYTWYGANGGFWGNQIAWLEADLAKAAAERDVRPWIFVGGHRPVYSVDDIDANGDPSGISKNLQDAVEGLFHEYKVDVYWCGHVHAYERQWPVYNNVNVEVGSSYVDPEYTFYIVHGAAGNDEKHEDWDSNPQAEWNAFADNEHYGIGLLTVESELQMSWKFMDAATREVLDEFTFSKSQP